MPSPTLQERALAALEAEEAALELQREQDRIKGIERRQEYAKKLAALLDLTAYTLTEDNEFLSADGLVFAVGFTSHLCGLCPTCNQPSCHLDEIRSLSDLGRAIPRLRKKTLCHVCTARKRREEHPSSSAWKGGFPA